MSVMWKTFGYQSNIVKHFNTPRDTFNRGLFEFPVNTGDLLIVMIESKIEDLLGHGRNHFIWTQSNLDLLAHLFGS